MNQIMAELFENLMDESRRLMIFSKKQTLTSKEVESAIRLHFTGELGKLAISYGRNSLQKYSESANWERNSPWIVESSLNVETQPNKQALSPTLIL